MCSQLSPAVWDVATAAVTTGCLVADSGCSRKCSAAHLSRRWCDPMTTPHLLCTTPHEGSAGGVVPISAIPLHGAFRRRALTRGSLKLCRWSCGRAASAAQRTALRKYSHPAWTPLGTQQGKKKKKAGKAFRQLWLGLHTQHQVLTDAARANLLARREVRERAYPYPKPTACCKACFFLPEGLQSRSA